MRGWWITSGGSRRASTSISVHTRSFSGLDVWPEAAGVSISSEEAWPANKVVLATGPAKTIRIGILRFAPFSYLRTQTSDNDLLREHFGKVFRENFICNYYRRGPGPRSICDAAFGHGPYHAEIAGCRLPVVAR